VGIALISLLALTSGLVLGHDAGRASVAAAFAAAGVAAARDYVIYLPVVLSG
jgi:hypothetical protein